MSDQRFTRLAPDTAAQLRREANTRAGAYDALQARREGRAPMFENDRTLWDRMTDEYRDAYASTYNSAEEPR